MAQIKTLIDLYIDANIVLILAFLVWAGAMAVLRRRPGGQDFGLQLRLTEGIMLAALLSPLIGIVFLGAVQAVSPHTTLNVADFAVAQFLDGRVEMKAQTFEQLLGLRGDLVGWLAGLESWGARVLVAGLLGGVVYWSLRILISFARLRGTLSRAFVWRRIGRLDLLISDEVSVPFSTRGLWRYKVVVPSVLLVQPGALRVVLAHEFEHMRRRDVEWEILLVLMQPFFFWNPAFGVWKRAFERLRELRCDAAVIRRGQVPAKDYAQCLLDICERAVAGRRGGLMPKVSLLSAGPGRVGRRSGLLLEERITALTAPVGRDDRRALLLWSILPLAFVLVALAASAIQKPADWSQDRLMLSTIVNLERLETRNTLP